MQVAEVTDWRSAALAIYSAHNGSRCVWCFLDIDDPAERTLYIRDGEYYLFHKTCNPNVEQAS